MKTAHREASHAKRRWQADPMSMFKVLDKIELYDKSEQAIIATPAQIAFEKLKTGLGTANDYDTLAKAVNVTITLSAQIDPIAERAAINARDSLVRTLERHRKIGRWGFDAAAMQDIAIALDMRNQMLGLFTPIQIFEAEQETARREARGECVKV